MYEHPLKQCSIAESNEHLFVPNFCFLLFPDLHLFSHFQLVHQLEQGLVLFVAEFAQHCLDPKKYTLYLHSYETIIIHLRGCSEVGKC